MTWLLRCYARVVDQIKGEKDYLANQLQIKQEKYPDQGTALLELYGVPIMKSFSNREVRKMFSDFSSVQITNYNPGFLRLKDFIPLFGKFPKFLKWIDDSTANVWGFYQFIVAKKSESLKP
jgi:hypothetical protein